MSAQNKRSKQDTHIPRTLGWVQSVLSIAILPHLGTGQRAMR